MHTNISWGFDVTNFQRIITVFALTASISGTSLAAVHLSLGGSRSESNAGYQKIESGAGSAGVSIDLGEYFRVGYTHRQELSSTTGYHLKEATNQYVYFQSRLHVVSNGVDLTLVLYGGEIITPFIFAGYALKQYTTDMQEADGTTEHMYLPLPSPEGGAGMAIKLNQKFSLKITYTMSQGVTQLPGGEAQPVIDSYTQLGIQYAL